MSLRTQQMHGELGISTLLQLAGFCTAIWNPLAAKIIGLVLFILGTLANVALMARIIGVHEEQDQAAAQALGLYQNGK